MALLIKSGETGHVRVLSKRRGRDFDSICRNIAIEWSHARLIILVIIIIALSDLINRVTCRIYST